MRAILSPFLCVASIAGFSQATAQTEAPPPATASPPPPIGDCMDEYAAFFEQNSDAITHDTATILDNVAAAILSPVCGAGRVIVAGHTDRSGPAAHNLDLSRRRAAAVARYLESRGVPAKILIIQAYGETRPLEAARNRLHEPQNRNVGILFRPADDQ
jgi:OOP family OmpA-OmpF porin